MPKKKKKSKAKKKSSKKRRGKIKQKVTKKRKILKVRSSSKKRIKKTSPNKSVTEYIRRLFNKSALGASTIKAANNPNTPYGANIIIISIIFKTTSLKESKKSLIGFALLGGIKIIEIPNNIEKNITCNMFLLSDAAATKLDGTKSTRGCNGPASLLSAAAFLFFSASESYCPISSVRVF